MSDGTRAVIVRLEMRDDGEPAWLDAWHGEWCTVAHYDEAKGFASREEAVAWVVSVGLMPSACSFWARSLEALP